MGIELNLFKREKKQPGEPFGGEEALRGKKKRKQDST